MSFARLHKLIAYLAAGLGLLALSLGSEVDRSLSVLIMLAYVGSWFVEGPILQRRGYATFWNVSVLAVLGLQLVRAALGASWLELGVEYAAFLQLSRLYYRRSAREYQHIAVLAFLHLIAATVLTTGIDYAFVFLGFVVVTPWMLALTHLRSEIEEHYTAAAGRSRGEHLARVLASRGLAGSGFLVGTALLAVPLFAATAGLFLMFPRVGMGFLSFRSDQGQPVAGFGRNVTLGGFGLIRNDPTVIMRVRLPVGHDTPEHIELRLRGTSFDRYDGREWTRTQLPPERVPRIFDRYSIVRWPQPGDAQLSVVLDPLDEPVVFLPEGTVALSIRPRVRSGATIPRRLVRAPGLDVRYVDADGLGLTYTAYVSPDAYREEQPLGADARARYLQIPPGHELVAQLARRVTSGAVTAGAKADRILRYLRDSGRYRYSLNQPDVGDRPPLDAFLFDAKRGHCEYFSTAMAVMLRAVGIPSRNVTGFVGGEYNRFGGYYAIRQGDAHSWVEAYVGGHWVTYDPTPATRDAIGPDEGLLQGVRELMDALRMRWSRHVVGYDLRDQVVAFRHLERWFRWLHHRPSVGPDGKSWSGAGSTSTSGTAKGTALAAALLVLLVVLGASFVWRRARRSREGSNDRAVRLYHALDRRLVRTGHPRPPDVTPKQHAEQLEREGFAHADVVREVTDAYLAARFAGERIDSDRMERLRRSVRSI